MKYFTKYLPVEGEINNNDTVQNEHGVGPYYEGEVKEGLKKVQLFLCSRDIQTGDILKECLPNGIEQKVHHFEAVLPYGVYVFEPWPSENEKWIHANKAFKVVGEVSPGAVWITEGMEFDESPGMYRGEWQALPIYSGDKHVTLLGSARQQRALLTQIPVEKYIILFRCPNCKTYH